MPGKPSFKFVSTRQRNFKCGEVYHIFQRGNHEAKVFSSDVERGIYLNRFFMLSKRHHVRVHNFVLMGNHIHFVLEQTRVRAISKLMRDLQGPHAREHNKLINKKGNLWTQHYGCKHVDSLAYYRTLMHYVETNPVKIGQCQRAEDYIWSGAKAHATNGPVEIRVDKTLTVKVELFFDKWRERCEDDRKVGWTEFLETHKMDDEIKKQIEMVMDGKALQRFANEQKVKKQEEARKAKRAHDELVKRVGPGQARQIEAEAKRAKAEAGRTLGAG